MSRTHPPAGQPTSATSRGVRPAPAPWPFRSFPSASGQSPNRLSLAKVCTCALPRSCENFLVPHPNLRISNSTLASPKPDNVKLTGLSQIKGSTTDLFSRGSYFRAQFFCQQMHVCSFKNLQGLFAKVNKTLKCFQSKPCVVKLKNDKRFMTTGSKYIGLISFPLLTG